MLFSLASVSLGLLAAGGLAAPIVDERRGLGDFFDKLNPGDKIGELIDALNPGNGKGIDANLFKTFNLMEQYASAAYCSNNHDSVGDKIKCSSGSCPMVQSANTTTLTEFQKFPGTDVTGYVALDHTNKLVVVAFRGSASIDNWMTNLDFKAVKTDLCTDCTAHKGFWQSWLDSRPGVLAAIKKASASAPTYKIVASGHSLGGAIATLATAQLRNEKYSVALYTFGAPRVAGSKLSEYISKQPGGNYRITNWNDPVPRLPPLFLDFTHVTPEYYINRRTGETAAFGDIKVFEGANNLMGNGAWVATDVAAHLWYFNSISKCAIEQIFKGN